ncbi:hypothetical protein [Xanthomonas bundabergensis]|uniref:hypothetical protein n=1 Tax=Xanthomonas bundabergensis TaxID=3160842 RepID=UPI0035121E92
MSTDKRTTTAVLSCASSLFALLGLFAGPIYFSAAFVCIAILAMRGDTRYGAAFATCAIVFLLAAFGYGIGKDLAQRDNLRNAQAVASAGQR